MAEEGAATGNFNREIRYLKGVGERRAALFGRLGISTVGELLAYYPRAYEDRSRLYDIAEAPDNEAVCIRATVAAPPVLSRVRRGLELVKLRAFDDSGSVDITFFNQAYVRSLLLQGETYRFFGKLAGPPSRRAMANPEFEPEAKAGERTGRIVPRYGLCKGLSNTVVSACVRESLSLALGEAEDILPADVRRRLGLCGAAFAVENIHFPADYPALDLARRRLAFEELFVLACAMGRMRSRRRLCGGIVIPRTDEGEFYASLPFSPTGAQKRAVSAALADMASGYSMNRLVQGDVGSGKTAVAAACVWAVCRAGYQAAFMAPTEILAEQHFATLSGFLEKSGLRLEKLTGSMTAREKREAKARIAAGEADLAVGTHALLTGDVAFSSLALVITDEQHRFGVNQRGALSEKGERSHVLVMSATPIPRTLALMIYGDLDASVIDELPPGRQKVDTFTVDERYRERLNGFIEKLAGEGRQIFVVCPMVEENGEYDPSLKNAVDHARAMAERFPRLRVACIHGRMKAKDKEAVMAGVVSGETDILVSTTVIEVGVDVPNAALMVIENAERFGLSQLHQLRGRVGRGSHKSWCILVSDAKGEEARARLQAMCKTNDGFQISEEDLRLRGPGDFFGSRQHGLPEMHIAALGGDMKLLQLAQEEAEHLLLADPELSAPENAALAERVGKLFSGKLDS